MPTITNNLRYPGQYFDAETGTLYNYFRDYNPVIGRYIESDPLNLGTIRFLFPKRLETLETLYKFEPGNQNLYVYVSNSPVNKIDPKGLLECGRCNLNECLNSCTIGGEGMRNFCRGIPDPRLRAACWGLEFASEVACKGWCYWNCT